MRDKLHWESLPPEQRQLAESLARQTWLEKFYLAGGTALALQLGHRQSIDFDFFTAGSFTARSIIEKLKALGAFELLGEDADTVHGTINGVKVSFFKYNYPMLYECATYRCLRIASIEEVALMKLEAIAGRGNKKDFIDLYFILERFPLRQLFNEYERKYGKAIANHYHLLKSFSYFEDAERQLMPLMLRPVVWEKVKQEIVRAVRDMMGKT